MAGLGTAEVIALLIVGKACAAASLLCSGLVVATYAALPPVRKFAFKLIMFLAVANAGAALGYLLAGAPEGSPLCMAQAVFVSLFTLSSICWVAVLTHAFFVSVVWPHKIGLRRREGAFHAVCWGAPLVLTLLPTTTDSYGAAGSWCWLRDDAAGNTWRMLQFYVPLWLVLAFCVTRMVAAVRAAQAALGSTLRWRRMTLALFPAILAVCYLPATINRTHGLFAPGQPVFALYLAHVVCAQLKVREAPSPCVPARV